MAWSNEVSAPSLIVPSRETSSTFLAIQLASVAVATLLVVARVYVRSIIIRNFGLDDFLIVIGLIIALVVCVMTSLTVYRGRRYSSQLSQGQTLAALNSQTQALKFCTIATAVGIFSALSTRLSICLFLLRIFRSVREWRLSLYAIMVFTAAATVPPSVSFTAQCQPIQKQWDPFIPGNCWSPFIVVRINYFGGAVSALVDWTLATLPIVFLWNIQMRTKVKVGICILMGMGYFTGICSIARTIGFRDVAASASHEATQIGSVIWAALEINIGIIAASIPTLNPLFNPSRFLRSRKAADIAERDDNKVRGKIVFHNKTPNALPSFFSYCLNTSRTHGVSQSEQSDDSSDAASLARLENVSDAMAVRDVQNESALERNVHDSGFLPLERRNLSEREQAR